MKPFGVDTNRGENRSHSYPNSTKNEKTKKNTNNATLPAILPSRVDFKKIGDSDEKIGALGFSMSAKNNLGNIWDTNNSSSLGSQCYIGGSTFHTPCEPIPEEEEFDSLPGSLPRSNEENDSSFEKNKQHAGKKLKKRNSREKKTSTTKSGAGKKQAIELTDTETTLLSRRDQILEAANDYDDDQPRPLNELPVFKSDCCAFCDKYRSTMYWTDDGFSTGCVKISGSKNRNSKKDPLGRNLNRTVSRPCTSSVNFIKDDQLWLVFRDYQWGLCYKLRFGADGKIDRKKPIEGNWHDFIEPDKVSTLLGQKPNVLSPEKYVDIICANELNEPPLTVPLPRCLYKMHPLCPAERKFWTYTHEVDKEKNAIFLSVNGLKSDGIRIKIPLNQTVDNPTMSIEVDVVQNAKRIKHMKKKEESSENTDQNTVFVPSDETEKSETIPEPEEIPGDNDFPSPTQFFSPSDDFGQIVDEQNSGTKNCANLIDESEMLEHTHLFTEQNPPRVQSAPTSNFLMLFTFR